MLSKIFLVFGAVSGAAGVILGAVTAHGLRARLAGDALEALGTVSLYLLIHGLLLIAVAICARGAGEPIVLRITGALLVTGVCLFCGSIGIAHLAGLRGATAVAPLGGVALIAGWLCFAGYGLWKF